jgi:alpha-beta hydrolase superfamily lysophospholipase
LHETAGSQDKTLKLCEGPFHDLLNDVAQDGVPADNKAWISARIAA